MITIANLLIFLHFAIHLAGIIGVLIGINHSNRVHGYKKWKVVLMAVWTLISLVALIGPEFAGNHCH